MLISLTSAGQAAIFTQQSGGPSIKVASVALGQAYGYTPSFSDTALHGTQVYKTAVTGLTNYNNGQGCEYYQLLDTSVGTFAFGEVGWYLEDGTLFALAVAQHLIGKFAANSTDANSITLRLPLNISNVAATFVLAAQPNAVGSVPILPTWEQVKTPELLKASLYVVTVGDDEGNASIIMPQGGTWSISTHPIRYVTGTVSSATTSSISSNAIGSLLLDSMAPLQYLLLMTSGANLGTIIPLISGSLDTANIGGAGFSVGGVPQAGDTFEILLSSVSQIVSAEAKEILNTRNAPYNITTDDNNTILNIDLPGNVAALPVTTDLPPSYQVSILNSSSNTVAVYNANFVFRGNSVISFNLNPWERVDLYPDFAGGRYLTTFHPV